MSSLSSWPVGLLTDGCVKHIEVASVVQSPTSATLLNSLSRGRLTSTALIPTSMTTAPSLIQSPVIISALPQAAMTMSALQQISCPFGVRECTTVTVASRLCKRIAAGVPTMLLLPTTQADFPLICTPDLSSSSMQPCTIKPVRLNTRLGSVGRVP